MRVEGLSTVFTTPAGPLAAVDGVDLTVSRGEVVAVVGESGCGKTMLALSILGVNPAFFSGMAAVVELLISLLGFYAAGAIFLNGFFGRVLVPLGAPLGLIRKGSAGK